MCCDTLFRSSRLSARFARDCLSPITCSSHSARKNLRPRSRTSMVTLPRGDNFKRSVMRVSRAALLIIPCGSSLDRAWSEASESAADEHAAQQSSFVALNLASALVRIARMIPKGQRQVMPAAVSAFLVGSEDSPGVKVQSQRLVELAATDPSLLVSNASIVRFVPWFVLTLIVVSA